MRIAAIYDVHGNLPALEAVLEDVRRARVDHFVVGGDIVPGPMAREALALLLDLDAPVHFIQGNCEVALLAEMEGADPGVPEQVREAMRWTAERLRPEHENLLAGWPRTLELDVRGLGKVLFCHGTPRSEDECFTRLTPEERLLPVFAPHDVSLVVCGHTHMQFDRMVGDLRVVNAGSVGMPFGDPGAYWLMLGPDVQLHHTSYDLDAAVQRIGETSYPGAREFAVNHVLQPPPEAEMLEVYSRTELAHGR